MLDFKSLLEKETNETVELKESNYLKILDEGQETFEAFEDYANHKQLIILSEPKFDQISDLLEEAENRVWMYRSYMNDNNDSPDYIRVTRDRVRKEYAEKYDLDIKTGKPLDATFDSYEYWEGVMAACRFLSGYGIGQTIDNVATGEDLLDT